MTYLHHKNIKRFNIEGDIHDEASIFRLKNEYISLLVTEMRLSGYVPRLDIDPEFTTAYNEYRKCFNFKLSVHGIYVGKRQAQWISGMDGVKIIFMTGIKSKESSLGQGSKLRQK